MYSYLRSKGVTDEAVVTFGNVDLRAVMAGLLGGGGASLAVETSSAQQLTVAAAADTYVVKEQPNQTYGTATKLGASNWSTPWHSDIYVRFAVPQPPPGTRPVAARVEFTFQKLTQQPAQVELRSVSGTSWPETTTSYANRPALGAVIATAPVAPGATTVSFAITPAGLGTGSFAVTNPSANSAAVLHSREHGAVGPRLVIDYASTLCGVSFARVGGNVAAGAAREDALFNGVESVPTFYGGMPAA